MSSPIHRTKGFTLIELLIAVVIIGIIAAIVLTKFTDIKEKAYVAAMMNDMRNAAPIEVNYFETNSQYSANPTAIPGHALSEDVYFIGGHVSQLHWSGVVGHRKSKTVCGVEIGDSTLTWTKVNCDKELTLPLGANPSNSTFASGATVSFNASAAISQIAYSGASDGSLYAASPSEIQLVAWDFGDGSTASGSVATMSNITHTFHSQGHPRLVLINKNGTVRGGTTPGPFTIEPVADVVSPSFIMKPNPAVVGQSVSMNATASKSSGGSIVTFAWDFGDASAGAGSVTSHSYTVDSLYLVKLTVTDDQGVSSDQTQEMQVGAASTGTGPVTHPDTTVVPVTITVLPAVPVSGDTVTMSASVPPTGGPYGFTWTFGDGGTDTSATTRHVYR